MNAFILIVEIAVLALLLAAFAKTVFNIVMVLKESFRAESAVRKAYGRKVYDPVDRRLLLDPVILQLKTPNGEIRIHVNRENACYYYQYGPANFGGMVWRMAAAKPSARKQKIFAVTIGDAVEFMSDDDLYGLMFPESQGFRSCPSMLSGLWSCWQDSRESGSMDAIEDAINSTDWDEPDFNGLEKPDFGPNPPPVDSDLDLDADSDYAPGHDYGDQVAQHVFSPERVPDFNPDTRQPEITDEEIEALKRITPEFDKEKEIIRESHREFGNEPPDYGLPKEPAGPDSFPGSDY